MTFVQDALDKAQEGRTSITIAHRYFQMNVLMILLEIQPIVLTDRSSANMTD